MSSGRCTVRPSALLLLGDCLCAVLNDRVSVLDVLMAGSQSSGVNNKYLILTNIILHIL